MALNYFKHIKTGDVKRSLKDDLGDDWEKLLSCPNAKFAEGKNKIRNQDAILLERARNHSRDVDLTDTIKLNLDNGMDAQVQQNFMNEKGTKRTKIDDI